MIPRVGKKSFQTYVAVMNDMIEKKQSHSNKKSTKRRSKPKEHVLVFPPKWSNIYGITPKNGCRFAKPLAALNRLFFLGSNHFEPHSYS